MDDLDNQDSRSPSSSRRWWPIAALVAITALAVGGYLYAQRTEERRPALPDGTPSSGSHQDLTEAGSQGDSQPVDDWTCDRRECFDARGRLVLPDHFGNATGAGLDPCAAIATTLQLAAGDTADRV